MRREGRRLKRDDLQTGNSVEVTDIVGSDRVAEFQSARTDDQIRKRQIDSLSRLFSTDASDDFRCGLGDRMDGNVRLQLIDKLSAPLAAFGCVGPVDTVGKFSRSWPK